MALKWIREDPARWDADKQRILGAAPAGVFDVDHRDGAIVPGQWGRAERDGHVVGYGWMDVTWGYAPVLVAVDPEARGQGVGTFLLDQLEAEAREEGLAYVFNAIPDAHPDPEGLARWLQERGFQPSQQDGKLLRRRVG